MKILYVSHTGLVSGGERSMLDLLSGLPSGVVGVLVTPTGPLSENARGLGVETVIVPETTASLALHPVHTTRAIGDIVRAAMVVRNTAARLKIDLVHANSVRAGIVTALVRRFGGPPTVCSARDVLPPSQAAVLAQRFVAAGVDVVIANSGYTAKKFLDAAPRAQMRTVFPPVRLSRFDPDLNPKLDARTSLGIPQDVPVLSVVAQITPWKGQLEAIEVLNLVRRDYPETRLLIAGEVKFASAATRFDNRAYMERLQYTVKELGLTDAVSFLGECPNVPEILACTDILLAPSREEPFGRSLIEAMAMGCIVVAQRPGGPEEIVDVGADGFLFDSTNPSVWAELVCKLIADPGQRAEIALRARRKVENRFALENHVECVMRVYAETIGDSSKVTVG